MFRFTVIKYRKKIQISFESHSESQTIILWMCLHSDFFFFLPFHLLVLGMNSEPYHEWVLGVGVF